MEREGVGSTPTYGGNVSDCGTINNAVYANALLRPMGISSHVPMQERVPVCTAGWVQFPA